MDDPLPTHDGAGLSSTQLDGLACVTCGEQAQTMYPVYSGPRGQLFRCGDCGADPRSTLPLSAGRREFRQELLAQRMGELQQLARQISDLEARLGAVRGQLDSRLYYLHEDGVTIAELARNAGRSRETVYASIDRYRAENYAPRTAGGGQAAGIPR